jgi:hypothetical protein
VQQTIATPDYRDSALAFSQGLKKWDSTVQAADVIERTFR